jgi:YVTN family beta-propeller protein
VIRAIVFLLSAILLCGQDSLLLILQKGGSSLGYYSAAGDYLATVPVGPHPHEMVLSPDGKYLYCTDNGTMQIEQEGKGNNTISMVDVAARKRVEIPLGNFRRPHGIDIDRATGNVLVTTELPDQLLVIDPNSRKIVRTYDTKGKTSHIVTLGRGGKFAYVSNSTSSNIAAIEMATGAVTLIPTGGRPEGTVLSKDGTRLYTANRVGDNITIIDTGRNAAIGEIKTGKAPNRIALTPDGASLVYSVMGDQGVEIADPLSKKVTGKVRVGGEPVSLTLSRDGKLAFASVQDQDLISVISVSERKLVRQFRTTSGAGPDPVMEIGAVTRR